VYLSLNKNRIKLYERLPEIYRVKDGEQDPPGQLKSYLSLVEKIFDNIHFDIESLYHNLFIGTCADWAIRYIGDLLGTSHISGDPWTLRADVADTIFLRKYKGTLLAIERLTYNLTQWGVHCVELRENLLWHQHLNHQRPDVEHHYTQGLGQPVTSGPVRGGIVNLRDPAVLSLIRSPFDEFAYFPDFRSDTFGAIRYNLPNLAIFLWTLRAYQVKLSQPLLSGAINPDPDPNTDDASFIVRATVNPTGEPLLLFNTNRFNFEVRQPLLPIDSLTDVDKTPNPIPRARLCQRSSAGNPHEYVALNTYNKTPDDISTFRAEISRVGLQFHLPLSDFAGEDFTEWSIRGENLCAWEQGIVPPLKDREIAIDPVIGRAVIGIDSAEKQQSLLRDLLVTYTYGSVGPIGAHPISRSTIPKEWRISSPTGETKAEFKDVNFHRDPNELQLALGDIQDFQKPVIIEIQDSMTHTLDISQVLGTVVEDGGHNLRLNDMLVIRAADNERPIIKLVNPLRFRPKNVKGSSPDEQDEIDKFMSRTRVVLEGLYITRDASFPDGDEPLIARAAINSLEFKGCTLDPGGYRMLNGERAPIRISIDLKIPYGFTDAAEQDAFNQVPLVLLERTISGPIFMDDKYLLLKLTDSIVDAGSGTHIDTAEARFAVSGRSSDPANSWSAPIVVQGITVFGRMRSKKVVGVSIGGIWVHTLEILDNQGGCIKLSYFSGKGDRLPMHFGCLTGNEGKLLFESEVFLNPSHGQLSHMTDFRIRERGPNDDAMGAFGFLFDAHKWRNLSIRYREFMPVGLRPVLLKVT
jgi:hypothetical protein